MFLLCWLLGVLIFVQPAHSKLASYVFPAYPIIPIILAWYLREISNPLKSISKKSFYYVGYLFAGFLILTASAGIYFAKKNIEYVVNIGPVYIFSLCTVCCAVVLFIFLRKKRDLFVVFPICGITATVLLMAFLGRQYAEPWISCKMISEKLNELDRSNSALLASKFYARGVRFYTDRNTAVIDIIGKDFFSPHPIPFLTDDDKVLNFLAKQAVTYGIVKRSSLDDLKRIVTKGSYRLSEFDSIGGKYIVKIERAAPNF